VDPIAIELAREEHLADIPGIELAGATLFAEADLPQEIRHRVTAATDLRDALNASRIWVAVHQSRQTVGFAMAEVVDRQAYLTELDVLPEFGRQGIGSRLVRAVAEWAKTCDFDSLSLITFRHLPWNAPFYEKLGFFIIDSAEHGPELVGLMEEERQVGINMNNRVAMKLKI
jgi:GNAT superfamily N-acetyltransferase